MNTKTPIDYEASFCVIFFRYLQLSVSCLEIFMTTFLSPNTGVYIDALDLLLSFLFYSCLFDSVFSLCVCVCVYLCEGAC